MESPSLEIFQTRLDAVLCSLLWVTLLRQGLDWVTHRGPFQPQPFCDAAKGWRGDVLIQTLQAKTSPESQNLSAGCPQHGSGEDKAELLRDFLCYSLAKQLKFPLKEKTLSPDQKPKYPPKPFTSLSGKLLVEACIMEVFFHTIYQCLPLCI